MRDAVEPDFEFCLFGRCYMDCVAIRDFGYGAGDNTDSGMAYWSD